MVNKYAFVITRSCPSSDVSNQVEDVFVINLTEKQMNRLSAKIERLFSEDGEGNDEWLGLEVTMLGAEVNAEQLLQHCKFSLLNSYDDEDVCDDDIVNAAETAAPDDIDDIRSCERFVDEDADETT